MKSLLRLIGLAILLNGALFLNGTYALANDELINEDTMFSGDNTIISQDQVINDNIGGELDEKRIGFSGEVNTGTSYFAFAPENNWSGLGGQNSNILSNQIAADLFLDIRLKKGVKSFLSMSVSYDPGGIPQTGLYIKEFFVDENWQNKVYFRVWKQVLKWGQSYFWNPTDLINIEKKDFANLNKIREGAYGAKIQIPAGVKQNTYFFVGLNDARKINDAFLAAKYEFLIGGVEMSVSGLFKEDYRPVMGYDFSGRMLGFNIYGELSLVDGGRFQTLDYDTLTMNSPDDKFIPQTSLGFTKSFNTGEIKNRINITGEFYYNQAGYDKNMIQRIESVTDPDQKNDLKDLYLANYLPYMNDKYYFAFFSSFNRFIISDLSLSCNGIVNFVDSSGTLNAGVNYIPALGDFTINFNIGRNLGAKYTEATMLGNQWSLSLSTKITF